MRTMRATLLDEINKMYVTAARAGGISEFKLLPEVSGADGTQPYRQYVGLGADQHHLRRPIVALVLSLPDTGPLFLQALLNQDMYLAGAMILIYCVLVVIGTLVSDLLLIWLDPRIRLEGAR